MPQYDFIFGECGSGKSAYLYKWITAEAEAHPEKKYYLFVPEQNTLKAQRTLVNLSSRKGLLNLDVLSFRLLYYRVLSELGKDPPVLLDDMANALLIRKAALEARAGGALSVYGPKINQRGFISQLNSVISEFCQYGMDADKLEAVKNAAQSAQLKAKLNDIYEIYTRFSLKLTSGKIIAEELENLLYRELGNSTILDGAVAAFDGYTGFTPIQLNILGSIIKKTSLCRFTVSIPPEDNPYRFDKTDFSDMWWLSRKTVADIIDTASKASVSQAGKKHVGLKKRPRAVEGTFIYAAADPVQEVRKLSGNIRREALVNGRRYMRMAVVVSNPEGYKEIIKREFQAAGIPYFMDDKAEAVGSPAVELLRAVLSMITKGYRYDDVMHFIKNPLITGITGQRKADRLDNYMRKTGMRGRKALLKAGEMLEGSLDGIINGIMELHDALKNAVSAGGKTEAVRAFAAGMGLREKLSAWADALEEEGYAKEAAENRRFMDLIDDLFVKIEEVLPDETMGTGEFVKLIEAGFTDMKGSLIPEVSDSLIVGDIKRSRLDDIDILFVVGANEGLFPRLATGGGLFTDYERLEMERIDAALPESMHFELAPDDRADSAIQEFYLRSCLAKPNLKLVISYPKAGRDGKALKPAPVLGSLGAEPEEYAETSYESVISKQEALELFSLLMNKQEKSGKSLALYKCLSEDSLTAGTAEKILSAAFIGYKRDPLSKKAADALYHNLLNGSVSRIEAFEACPYSHFAKYGLKLKERECYDVEASDIGNLLHGALDGIFKRLGKEHRSFRDIPEEELGTYAHEAVEKTMAEYGGESGSMLEKARNMALKDALSRMTKKTLCALKFQDEQGAFTTFGTEVDFGFRDGQLKLSGKVDRIDSCVDDEGKTYVKVIDYKTGSTSFDLNLCLEGKQLQLTAYMDQAIREVAESKGGAEEAKPCGMFYYHVADPVLDYASVLKRAGNGENALNEAKTDMMLENLRLNGAVNSSPHAVKLLDKSLNLSGEAADEKNIKGSLVMGKGTVPLNEEELEALMDYVKRLIKKDAASILSGNIEAAPYRYGQNNSCTYCRFSGMCGFDPQKKGCRYKNISKKTREEQKKVILKDTDNS